MWVVENAFGILKQKFQIYQRTLQPLSENEDSIIFATCVLHIYLRDQGVGLSDINSSANHQSNLTKIPNQEWSAVLLKQETTLNRSLIFRLDLCLGRMKERNDRLTYNIQFSFPGSVAIFFISHVM